MKRAKLKRWTPGGTSHLTLSIPNTLRARMVEASLKRPICWSHVAAQAFEREIRKES